MAREFYEFTTQDELRDTLFESTVEVQAALIEKMITECDMNLRLNYKLADHKVLTEHGSYEDLEKLFEAANEQAGEEIDKISEGILEMVSINMNELSRKVDEALEHIKDKTNDTPAKRSAYVGANLECIADSFKKFASDSKCPDSMKKAAKEYLTSQNFKFKSEKADPIKKHADAIKSFKKEIPGYTKDIKGAVKTALKQAKGAGDTTAAKSVLSTIRNALPSYVKKTGEFLVTASKDIVHDYLKSQKEVNESVTICGISVTDDACVTESVDNGISELLELMDSI